MKAGLDAYARAAFFEAHEHWEPLWLKSVGAERTWLQGLIQIAAGLHARSLGRLGPATSLLVKALAKLDGAPSVMNGVDVARVRVDGERVLALLRAGGARF